MAKAAVSFVVTESMLTAYATNNRINLYLLENLPDEVWRMKGPGGKGREAGSIFSHMHNVRLMWLKAIGVVDMPAKLDPDEATKIDVKEALEASYRAVEVILKKALETDGKVKGFKPDVGSFLAYLLAHDAHHRGQITMLARLCGHAVSQSAMYGLWEWGTR